MNQARVLPFLTILASASASAVSPVEAQLLPSACGSADEIASRALNLIQRETLALTQQDRLILDPGKASRIYSRSEEGELVETFSYLSSTNYSTFHDRCPIQTGDDEPFTVTAETRCAPETGRLILQSILIYLPGSTQPLAENEIFE